MTKECPEIRKKKKNQNFVLAGGTSNLPQAVFSIPLNYLSGHLELITERLHLREQASLNIQMLEYDTWTIFNSWCRMSLSRGRRERVYSLGLSPEPSTTQGSNEGRRDNKMKTEKKLWYLIKAAAKKEYEVLWEPREEGVPSGERRFCGTWRLLTKTVGIGASRNVGTKWGVETPLSSALSKNQQ